MKRRIVPSLVLAGLALAACNSNTTPPLTGGFRVANGITDSNGLDASINDVATFSGIGTESGSGITDVPLGSYKSQLTSNSKTFTVNNVSIDHNNVTTVYAYGSIGGGSEAGFPAEESLDAPTNGQAVVQAVHAAFAESGTNGTLNFYFVSPGSGLGGATPFAATFGQSPSSHALTGAKYEIIVAAGTTPVFDSGPTGISLPYSDGSNVFQVAALDATGGNQSGSPIVVLILDNNGHQKLLLNGQN